MAKKNTIDITDLGQPYTPPEGTTPEALAELEANAREQAIALLSKDNYTDEEFARAEYLAAAADACKQQADTLAQAAAERKTRADELRARVAPPAEVVEETDEGEGGGGQTAETVAAEPAEAVVASGKAPVKVPSVSDIAKTVKQPDIPTRKGSTSLVAAADVPGFAAGAELSNREIGEAWLKRTRGFANMAGTTGHYQAQVARRVIEAADEGLVASGTADTIDITEALDHAADEKRLPGQSLVASGGWCAPSEPLYDLLNLISSDGLLTLPEITVKRGGIKWATGPDFNAVFANGGFFKQTEAQAISGTTKALADVPCPSPTEQRLGVAGLFLTSPILAQKGWPEAVGDFLEKAQAVYLHYLSSLTMADIVTGSTAVDLSATGASSAALAYGALSTVLGAVALQIEDMKYKGRLSRGQSVEVVLPFFARGIFRADLMKRQVTDPTEIVLTDAQIDAMFTALGANPQYVYDWQDHTLDGVNQTGFGGSTAIVSWPQTFKVVIYPAGTWARAVEPVIDISALYDSTLLAGNEYVALFQEQGRSTLKRGFDSRIVKVQSNPNGGTGGTVTVAGTTATAI